MNGLVQRAGLWLGALWPAPESGIGLPRDASADGWRIDRLLQITNYFVIALAVIGLVWLLIAVIAHRQGRAALFFRGSSRRAAALPLGIAAAVFLAVDGNLFVTSTRDLDSTFLDFASVEKEPGAVRVEVNGQQWAWSFRYAGADGRFATADDAVTLGDFRVPLGRPVLIELASSDVVHALYLPNFRVKLDAIPGRVNRVWFRPTALGQYDVACAQHCGVHHYKMRAQLTVMSSEDFEAWAMAESEDGLRLSRELERAEKEQAPAIEEAIWPEWGERLRERQWGWPWGVGR